MMTTLKQDADLDHTTARQWYEAQGLGQRAARDRTDGYGALVWVDVPRDIPFSDLDASDEDVIRRLKDRKSHPYYYIDRYVAADGVRRARALRQAAEAIERHLRQAVREYLADNADGCDESLIAASRIEAKWDEQGHAECSNALRSQLIDEDEDQ